MVYILGVDHLIQYKNGIVPEEIFSEFREYLADIISSRNIGLLAEEFNEEFLNDVYHSDEATVRTAALESGIDHCFCDPIEAERFELGIPYFADLVDEVKKNMHITGPLTADPSLRIMIRDRALEMSRSFWDVRENCWMEKIKGFLDKNILFVCGHEHAERFKALLDKHGVPCVVENPFWKREIFSDYDSLGL